MLQIGGDPTRPAALLNGTIDASVFNPAAIPAGRGSRYEKSRRTSKK